MRELTFVIAIAIAVAVTVGCCIVVFFFLKQSLCVLSLVLLMYPDCVIRTFQKARKSKIECCNFRWRNTSTQKWEHTHSHQRNNKARMGDKRTIDNWQNVVRWWGLRCHCNCNKCTTRKPGKMVKLTHRNVMVLLQLQALNRHENTKKIKNEKRARPQQPRL